MKLKPLFDGDIKELARSVPPDPVVAAYMRSAITLMSNGPVWDVVAGHKSWADGSGIGLTQYKSDLVWFWRSEIAYYVEKYGLPLPREFTDRAHRYKIAPHLTDDDERERLMQAFYDVNPMIPF